MVITRSFDAPSELVFRAHTEPDLLLRWLGRRDLTMTVDRYEVRDGGRWRYVHRDAQRNVYGFHGVFHGNPSPRSIVQTFEFEGAPGNVQLDTLTMEEGAGRPLVRRVSSFQSVAERDGMVAAGMERGVRDGDDRLDALLTTLEAEGRG